MAKNENENKNKKNEKVAMYGNEWYSKKAPEHMDIIKAEQELKAAEEFKKAENEKKWAMKKQAYYFYRNRGNQSLCLEEIKNLLSEHTDLMAALSDNAKALLLNESTHSGGGKTIIDEYFGNCEHGSIPLYLLMYQTADGKRIGMGVAKETVMEGLMLGEYKQRFNLEQLKKYMADKGLDGVYTIDTKKGVVTK